MEITANEEKIGGKVNQKVGRSARRIAIVARVSIILIVA